jgi:hypothetical protein
VVTASVRFLQISSHMKYTITLLTLLFALPSMGEKINDAKCSDLVSKTNQNVTPEYIAETEGYNAAGQKVSEEIDMGEYINRSKQINDQCAKDKTAKVDLTKKGPVETSMADNTGKKMLNPTKAKCKDFLELDEAVQPVAVYWVAGNNKSGKLKNGEMDEMFLEQPVVDLVRDCKSHPKASFYARTKAWVKHHV